MSRCKFCKKPIPKGEIYCNFTCQRKYLSYKFGYIDEQVATIRHGVWPADARTPHLEVDLRKRDIKCSSIYKIKEQEAEERKKRAMARDEMESLIIQKHGYFPF